MPRSPRHHDMFSVLFNGKITLSDNDYYISQELSNYANIITFASVSYTTRHLNANSMVTQQDTNK